MDLISKKKEQFAKALETVKEVIALPQNTIIRDSSIQRFEYTTELFWKMLKEHLQVEYGIIANSPKTVIREAVSQGIFCAKEGELFLRMIEDRNLTSHAYEGTLADEIAQRIPEYAEEMEEVFLEIQSTSSL